VSEGIESLQAQAPELSSGLRTPVKLGPYASARSGHDGGSITGGAGGGMSGGGTGLMSGGGLSIGSGGGISGILLPGGGMSGFAGCSITHSRSCNFAARAVRDRVLEDPDRAEF